MRSKAQFKSHPLHPIFVVFPLAFFTGTLLFDGLGLITGNNSLTVTGEYLNIAGIIGALLAAIPGIIDYIFTVPPKSSASKRAAKHGLINTSVVVLFIFILIYRQSKEQLAGIRVGLEGIGIILLAIAGWLGGTLVHRNQIGVDIRYANAGKWKEAYRSDKNGAVEVVMVNELQLNQMKLIHVKGKRIVIGKTEDGYVAFDDHCTHRGGSLAGGSLMCNTVQCPWHGSQFDVRTGMVNSGPAKEKIHIYKTYEVEDKVFVQL